MDRRRLPRLAFAFIGALALLLPSGCSAYQAAIAPPAPLAADNGNDLTKEAQVAVGPDGSHHMLYTQFQAFGRLVYAYQKAHEAPRYLIIAPSGDYDSYEHPDMAVTDAGDVVIVWAAEKTGTGDYYPCWATFRPEATSAPACTQLSAQPMPYFEPPLLAAQGSTVYAVYTSTIPAMQHDLVTTPLLPETQSARVLLSKPADDIFEGFDARVGSTGKLHVAYSYSGGGSFQAGYLNYLPGSPVATYPETNFEMAEEIATPALALALHPGGADTAYYAFNGVASSTQLSRLVIFQMVDAPAGSPSAVEPLDVSLHWQISDAPAIAVVADVPFIYFSAQNDFTGAHADLFALEEPFSVPSPEAVNLTSSPESESAPRAVTVAQTSLSDPAAVSQAAVVFFRHLSDGNYQDAFVYAYAPSAGTGLIRQVYDGGDGYIEPSYDLAARGDDLLAAWIDLSNSRVRPVFSYNTEVMYIPQILR